MEAAMQRLRVNPGVPSGENSPMSTGALPALLGGALSFGLLAAVVVQASARDLGQWGDQPSHVREWFKQLRQPDNPRISCCGEADAYQADSFEVDGDHYVAIITNGEGDSVNGKPAIANGTRIAVPNAKMKWDEGNPTGHGILFLQFGTGKVFCYITPGGV
jgi:hypothetical protein